MLSPDHSARHSPLALLLLASAILGGLVAVAVFVGLGPRPAEAAPADLAALQSSFVDVAAQVSPAVVNINTEKEIRQQVWGFDTFNFDPWRDPWPPFRPYERVHKVTNLGSGFIISPDGFVLTNAHGETELIPTWADRAR